MSAVDWASYIGLPWQAGAQGPVAFDCMALFGHVQRAHFGVDVPHIIAPDYDNADVLVNLFAKHKERDQWTRIDTPEHGCAVIVHGPLHIGTWLNLDGGGVLHCVRGAGVVFTHDSAWSASGFGRRTYYRHRGVTL